MATDSSVTAITEADVDAFGHKLAAWAEQLNASERSILMAAFARGAIAEEGSDVQGYSNWLRDGFFISAALIRYLSGLPPPPPPPAGAPDRDLGRL